MKLLLVSLSLLAISCADKEKKPLADYLGRRDSAGSPAGGSGGAASNTSSWSFQLDEIKQILREEKPQSVSEFLSSWRIPLQMRERFVLLPYSFSPQKADKNCPRAFLLNQDSSLVMTFNCGQYVPGISKKNTIHAAKSVEIARFNPQNQEYENYSLYFAGDSIGELSQVNPELCQKCHMESDWAFSMAHTKDFLSPKQITQWRSEQARVGAAATSPYRWLRYQNKTDNRVIEEEVDAFWGPHRGFR